MARAAFFSFHYQRDIFRVNTIRNNDAILGVAAAGFRDASLWEETKRKGRAAIEQLINNGIKGTTVTVVMIGAQTAYRDYVEYEIRRSLQEGSGLLGLRIHKIKGIDQQLDSPGPIPALLAKSGCRTETWEFSPAALAQWIERAYQERQHLNRNV